MVVDGYNVAHAWPCTRDLFGRVPLEDVRRAVVERLAAYAAAHPVRVVVVFDSPRRAGAGREQVEVVDGVEVRFSTTSGSADHLIERLVYEAMRADADALVRVVTADRLIRDMVRAMGADTMSPDAFDGELGDTQASTRSRMETMERGAGFGRRLEHHLAPDVLAHLEALRRGDAPAPASEAGSDPGAGGTGRAEGDDGPPR